MKLSRLADRSSNGTEGQTKDLSRTACFQPSPGHAPHARLIAAPVLNRYTYETLIDDARMLYTQGARTLHIDLHQTTHIEQSGLFALYCVFLIFQGEQPPSAESGMWALRNVTERVQLNAPRFVQLTHVPHHLRPLLARAHLL
ncbi:MAG: hypothetical protein KDE19_03485 [Caldilineaceae bacterium]|nr:hypothetical protein [Caldilineaceae bacterium]